MPPPPPCSFQEFVHRVRGSGLGPDAVVWSDAELRRQFDSWDTQGKGAVRRQVVEDFLDSLRDRAEYGSEPPLDAEALMQRVEAQDDEIYALKGQLQDAQGQLTSAASGDTGIEKVYEEMLQTELKAHEKTSEELERQKRRNAELRSELEAERIRSAELEQASQEAGGARGKTSAPDLERLERHWRAALQEKKQLKKQLKIAGDEREREKEELQRARSDQAATGQELDRKKRSLRKIKQDMKDLKQQHEQLKQEMKDREQKYENEAADAQHEAAYKEQAKEQQQRQTIRELKKDLAQQRDQAAAQATELATLKQRLEESRREAQEHAERVQALQPEPEPEPEPFEYEWDTLRALNDDSQQPQLRPRSQPEPGPEPEPEPEPDIDSDIDSDSASASDADTLSQLEPELEAQAEEEAETDYESYERHEAALAQKALRNFEDFHKMPPGTATLDQVGQSSAGVTGWADADAVVDGGEAVNAGYTAVTLHIKEDSPRLRKGRAGGPLAKTAHAVLHELQSLVATHKIVEIGGSRIARPRGFEVLPAQVHMKEACRLWLCGAQPCSEADSAGALFRRTVVESVSNLLDVEKTRIFIDSVDVVATLIAPLHPQLSRPKRHFVERIFTQVDLMDRRGKPGTRRLTLPLVHEALHQVFAQQDGEAFGPRPSARDPRAAATRWVFDTAISVVETREHEMDLQEFYELTGHCVLFNNHYHVFQELEHLASHHALDERGFKLACAVLRISKDFEWPAGEPRDDNDRPNGLFQMHDLYKLIAKTSSLKKYPPPGDSPELSTFAGLWHAKGDSARPHDPNPFHESFVLYEDPHSGNISGVAYTGGKCREYYAPPPSPDLFMISGEEKTNAEGHPTVVLTQNFPSEDGSIEQTTWRGTFTTGPNDEYKFEGKWKSNTQEGDFIAEADGSVGTPAEFCLRMDYEEVEAHDYGASHVSWNDHLREQVREQLLAHLLFNQVDVSSQDDGLATQDDLQECIQTLKVHVEIGTGPGDVPTRFSDGELEDSYRMSEFQELIDIRIAFAPQSLAVAWLLDRLLQRFRQTVQAGEVSIRVGRLHLMSRDLTTDFFETAKGEEWAAYGRELRNFVASNISDELQRSAQQRRQSPFAQKSMESPFARLSMANDDPTLADTTNQSVSMGQQHLGPDAEEPHTSHTFSRRHDDSSQMRPLHSISVLEPDVQLSPLEQLRNELATLKPHAVYKRAEREGVDEAALAEVDDIDAVISLIVAQVKENQDETSRRPEERSIVRGDKVQDAPWDAYRTIVPVEHSYTHRHDAHKRRLESEEGDSEITMNEPDKTSLSEFHESIRRKAQGTASDDEESSDEEHTAALAKSFVDAATQQMERCYALCVDGHSSLGEGFDQLRLKLLHEAYGAGDETDPKLCDDITAKLRKAWVATSSPARLPVRLSSDDNDDISHLKLAEQYYRRHVDTEVDEERTWGLSATRKWFVDNEQQLHSEDEVKRYDQGSFNGIYTATSVDPETGHVEIVHDARGFPVYRNGCGRYLYRTSTREDPGAEKWVFSRVWDPAPRDGTPPRGVAATRTGNGAVPTGQHDWKGKPPPALGKPSTRHATGTIQLYISELFMKPGFAEDPKRVTEWKSPAGISLPKLEVHKALPTHQHAQDHKIAKDCEHPEYGARCVLSYREEHPTTVHDGRKKIHHQTGMVQLADPLGRQYPYFEVEILSDNLPEISIGLSYLLGEHAPELEEHPGWYPGSVGYHFDNCDLCDGTGTIRLPIEEGMKNLRKGDKVQCGLVWKDGGFSSQLDTHEVWFAVQLKDDKDKKVKELPQRATLRGFPKSWIGREDLNLYPTIGMSRCKGHGLAVSVFLGTNQPGQAIGMAYSPPIDTKVVKTKHNHSSGMTFQTVRHEGQTYVVLHALPEGDAGVQLRMHGLREGMVLMRAGRENLDGLLEGSWRNYSAQKILEEVERLCALDPHAAGGHAGDQVTLEFKGRFEALSEPNAAYVEQYSYAHPELVDVNPVPSDATTLHHGTPATPSRPRSHRQEIEDRIMRKILRDDAGSMTEAQHRERLAKLPLSKLKGEATRHGLPPGSYNISPVRNNSAGRHPSKRALRQ